MRFWLAGVSANQMLMVAVAWHMYDITSSAWDLGLVGLFQFVPALILMLPAGHAADRFHRARIFAVCMGVQAVVALMLIFATEFQFASRELILGISVLLGVARAFKMPAQQALTPKLVPQDMLPSAVALSASGMQVAIIG
jgi:MFS family permease